jgi:inhibitor of the pro-sigma K processing machinery
MDYIWIAIGFGALWILNKVVLAPIRSLVFNLVIGLIVLFLVNSYGGAIGLAHVPITWITGLIIGIFGLPGVAVVTLYYTLF